MSAEGPPSGPEGVRRPATPVPIEVWGGAASTTYRYPMASGVRVVGVLVVVVGALLLLAAVTGFPSAMVWIVVSVGVLVVVAVVRLVVLPLRVLRLTSAGFSIHNVRSKGAGAAPWAEVASVSTTTLVGGRVVIFDLAGGENAILPLAALGGRAGRAQHEIHARLNTAHGYRPLSPSQEAPDSD